MSVETFQLIAQFPVEEEASQPEQTHQLVDSDDDIFNEVEPSATLQNVLANAVNTRTLTISSPAQNLQNSPARSTNHSNIIGSPINLRSRRVNRTHENPDRRRRRHRAAPYQSRRQSGEEAMTQEISTQGDLTQNPSQNGIFAANECHVCTFPIQQRVALIPCFHISLCFNCATRLHDDGSHCPFCRTEITRIQRLHS